MTPLPLTRGDRIAILTSGGDAPGMNAALRGAARVAAELGIDLVGVEDGYVGLLADQFVPLNVREIDEAARRGGTFLGTARSRVFPTPEGQAKARAIIQKRGLAGLIVVGGNGSLAGARSLLGTEGTRGTLRIGGIPASIDNDLGCTSMSIGVDTAMNTIVEACDRLCDTATAHRRTFVVEVMGRDCGYLAMTAGIAAGADAVLVPELDRTDEEVIAQIKGIVERSYASGRRRVLVLKAEGVKISTQTLKDAIDAHVSKTSPDIDSRVTVLGHVVRGGTPSAFDRLLGARLANVVVRALFAGESDFMAGWLGPGMALPSCAFDPYVVLAPIPMVLTETEKLHRGETLIAAWRKKIYREVESVLDR
ncbi:MAG: ATP-dependent 6-phosphofructokinase [Polyangiaceae bacterium]